MNSGIPLRQLADLPIALAGGLLLAGAAALHAHLGLAPGQLLDPAAGAGFGLATGLLAQVRFAGLSVRPRAPILGAVLGAALGGALAATDRPQAQAAGLAFLAALPILLVALAAGRRGVAHAAGGYALAGLALFVVLVAARPGSPKGTMLACAVAVTMQWGVALSLSHREKKVEATP